MRRLRVALTCLETMLCLCVCTVGSALAEDPASAGIMPVAPNGIVTEYPLLPPLLPAIVDSPPPPVARLRVVNCPECAAVYIDGQPTRQRGVNRTYELVLRTAPLMVSVEVVSETPVGRIPVCRENIAVAPGGDCVIAVPLIAGPMIRIPIVPPAAVSLPAFVPPSAGAAQAGTASAAPAAGTPSDSGLPTREFSPPRAELNPLPSE